MSKMFGHKMNKKNKLNKKKVQLFFLTLLTFLILCLCSEGLTQEGRSFRIMDYEAQAFIQENGDVEVSELFTYQFSGEFNGITRSIGLKDSDGLAYFYGSEYEPVRKQLEVTQEKEIDMVTFRIYDKSTNMTKRFLLEYRLKNVVTKYNDIAEFYWKFFDTTNTSPIERARIEIYFPNQTVSADNLKVFGHGPSQGQVTIEDSGYVLYRVDDLPSKELLEARILFPTSFVPNANRIVAQDKYEDIMREELNWAKSGQRRHSIIVFALLLIPIVVVLNLIMAVRLYFKYDRELKPKLKLDYYRELPQDITPAVLSYLMDLQGATSKDIMATLMDLARKKYLRIDEETSGLFKKKDYRFTLINKNFSSLKKHEVDLIDWLFGTVGRVDSVSLKEIEQFAKSSAKSSWAPGLFRQKYLDWQKIVKKEFDKYGYFNKDKPGLEAAIKTLVGEIGVVLVLMVLALFFKVGWYVWIPLLFAVLLTGIGLIIYGSVIRKKTQIGVNEYEKWAAFKRFLLHFSNMKDYEIPSLVVWEHYLVYAITLGVAEKVIAKLRPILAAQNITMNNSVILYHMTSGSGQLNAASFRSFDRAFSSAFSHAAPSTGSGGGFSSGGGSRGGGGGGGGGGAGAF